ncbi:hypothetical protein Z043_112755 [Scleropages formosus]|uniref:CWF21 domain-containing protein n=1 Tax=Scleropages formosus TaxID=113540 RepID=A0A0P7V2B0_SCLFO|nr:hypothetical protein Z043_112755 [Scleropages formosus]
MYDGARAPSPQDGANGFPQPGASTGRPKPEEEVQKPEPMPAKKAHREILDHERKRRVELKCMELQEMMEEQGCSEEEFYGKCPVNRFCLQEFIPGAAGIRYGFVSACQEHHGFLLKSSCLTKVTETSLRKTLWKKEPMVFSTFFFFGVAEASTEEM